MAAWDRDLGEEGGDANANRGLVVAPVLGLALLALHAALKGLILAPPRARHPRALSLD